MTVTVAIGDVAKIQSGSIDPRKYPDTLFQLYSIPGFDNGKTPEQLLGSNIRSSKSVLPKRGVLFSKLNPRINRVWLVDSADAAKRIASTEFVCLVPEEERLDLEFLAWRLRVPGVANQLPIAAAAATKSRQRIIPRSLLSLPIPLPPLNEQRRIVGILNRAEKIERLRQQAARRLREFIPALFVKMFGDPVENPMGWEKASLGDLSEIQGGLQITKNRNACPIARPYLRVANVHRDRLDLSEIKWMHITEQEFERVRLTRGDLLVVEGHGNASEIGRVAMWDGSIPDCVHQNHLIRARLDHSAILPEFACAYLNSPSGRQQLLRSGKTTSGLSTISTSNVKSCIIFVPPHNVQQIYARSVQMVRSMDSLEESSSSTVSLLRTSLMSQFLGARE